MLAPNLIRHRESHLHPRFAEASQRFIGSFSMIADRYLSQVMRTTRRPDDGCSMLVVEGGEAAAADDKECMGPTRPVIGPTIRHMGSMQEGATASADGGEAEGRTPRSPRAGRVVSIRTPSGPRAEDELPLRSPSAWTMAEEVGEGGA